MPNLQSTKLTHNVRPRVAPPSSAEKSAFQADAFTPERSLVGLPLSLLPLLDRADDADVELQGPMVSICRLGFTAHTIGHSTTLNCAHFRSHAGMVVGRSADRSREASAALLYRGLSSTDAADRWPSPLASRNHAGRPIHRRFSFFQQPTGARSGDQNRIFGLLVTGTYPRPFR
jgi:hypothetical protein